MKQKVGVIIRFLSVIIFTLITILSFANGQFNLFFLIFFFLVLILLNISQILSPLNLKRNLYIYFGMFIYFIFVYLWAINYSFRKEFDYHGVKLYYQYSIFNGTYHKMFGKKSYYDFDNLKNEEKKQKAIDVFWFLQCEHYEREKNYTKKQKANLKAGKIKIYSNYDYTKGNLKDLILNEFTKNKIYIENYNYYTKKQKIDIDTIVKYRLEIFNINIEE